MSKQINKIVIVGGGSAGWMSAATMIKCFPEKEIVLVESPGIPTVGVGESTIGGIGVWLNLLDIKDEDFMKYTDASYKLSIRFTDFYKKGSGSFHYPFGVPDIEGQVSEGNDWFLKKIVRPETPLSDYADCMYPNMALVRANKIDKNMDGKLPQFIFDRDTAYHFDAGLFASWLRDRYAIPRGVKHIQEEVVGTPTNEDGIEHLVLKNGDTISADLFIDCTGFKSHLLAGALQEPFISYEDILPNNSAWATRVQYNNKEQELVNYTDCHAIDNGWVWSIPLWSRLGTGYVYSDKYVSDQDALVEFKSHLETKGYSVEGLEFRNIKMRVGVHDRLWVKNVCAIGLSAGFIEPLESNGLYTVHEFLFKLVRTLQRGSTSRFDKEMFNSACRGQFRDFAEFVSIHYALSHRDDTEYWRDTGKRDYAPKLKEPFGDYDIYKMISKEKYFDYRWSGVTKTGIPPIATGLNLLPTDWMAIQGYSNNSKDFNKETQLTKYLVDAGLYINYKRIKWDHAVENSPTLIQYLQENIHNETN
jgi:tryptophan halogenase